MPFNKPYEFQSKNIVVIQHAVDNKHLRVKPNRLQQINHNGGKGEFARWEADPQSNASQLRLKSTKTNKYLRIVRNKKTGKYAVNVGGDGGKFTVFNIHYVDENDHSNGRVKLESTVFPGTYLAVDNNGVRTGSGGPWCELTIYRQTGKNVNSMYNDGSNEEEDAATTTEDEEEDEQPEEEESEDEEFEFEEVVVEDAEQHMLADEEELEEEEKEDEGSVVIHDDEEDEEEEEHADPEVSPERTAPSEHYKLLEGYCLVFLREQAYHQLEVIDLKDVADEEDLAAMEEMCALTNAHGIKNDNDKALAWRRKPDIADQEFEAKAPKKLRATSRDNLLRGFNSAHIQYKIVFSRPSMDRPNEEDQINPNDEGDSKYIYVLIWMDELYTEAYADYQDVSVLINREEAIKAGRQFSEFALAHRTYLPGVDRDNKIRLNEENVMDISAFARKRVDQQEDTTHSVMVQGFGSADAANTNAQAIENKTGDEIEKLPIECWNNIHIPFEYNIKSDEKQHAIYELYPSANNPQYQTVVTHRLYLRILYSCLVDDRSMKGANFLIDYYVKDKNHPFQTMFALHEYDNQRFYPVRNPRVPRFAEKLFKCGWINREMYAQIVDDIREYFGEYIAFYYGFLTHYIQSMLPMVIIGLIWFIVQLGAGTISVGGSTFYVLITVIWSTILIEVWYRRESALRFKWGMCRYHETEVPRPTFRGTVRVSEYNGDIIEDHRNMFYYWLRIVFSLSTMVLCIGIVIVVVGSIWILKRKWKDNSGYTMAIGIINAIQIKIFNVLYNKLAFLLNDFEQHRLVEDYYNHLVIKRIIFMVVNSFNSLFYMAFYDDSYENNEVRLESLRIQLFTLFFTSIVILNFLEVLIPKIPELIRKFKKYRAERKYKDNEDPDADDDDDAGNHNKNVKTKKQIETAIHVSNFSGEDVDLALEDPEGEFNDVRFTGGFQPAIILDIETQNGSPTLPSTLDNVAEVVILHGYIIIFSVVLPAMPLLAYINSIFEIRIDVYNMTQSQRPFPLGADGIGVWRAVLSIFNTISVFSNMAVIAWDTNLPEVVLGLKLSGKIVWYFLICLFLLVVMVSIRMILPNESPQTNKAMARQEQCERLVTLLQDVATSTDPSTVGQKKELVKIKQ